MTFKLRKNLLLSAVMTAVMGTAVNANAGGTITFGDDKSVTVGFGLRSSFSSVEDGAPDGKSRSSDFNLDSVRLYTSASLNKYIKGTFNTEKKADNSVEVIDAIGQFEFMDEFNIWAGRQLPPSDRANLDGPYYLNAWDYPGIVSQYPSLAVGRDNGVSVWGKLFDKKIVYSVGSFEGNNSSTKLISNPNQSDNLLYAGRIAVNFWNPEPAPAYYTGSTYYGSVDIFTVALVGQFQKDAVGTATVKDDYLAYNVDALLEKTFAPGTLTLEGAAYKYDFSPTAVAADPGAPVKAGKAYLGEISFLFPQVVGWGKFQPYVRYQKFDVDGTATFTNANVKSYDLGLNYIIDGPNAKLSATYTNTDQTASKNIDKFVVGMQLQF